MISDRFKYFLCTESHSVMAVDLNTELFIDLIEERACLWDLLSDSHKDKQKKAWLEIALQIFDDFENCYILLHCQMIRKATPRVCRDRRFFRRSFFMMIVFYDDRFL